MPRPADRALLGVAALGVLLAAADTYVVVLALPDIMAGVGVGVTEFQQAAPIISVFLLGYVALLPLFGRIADLTTRLAVLVGCLLLFAVGSLVTATSHELAVLVVGRALQGAGGGGLVPATLALVADLWPPERRGTPLGVVGAVQELGSVLGPLLGALILAVAGWRDIFWVNLALALILGGALLWLRRVKVRVRPLAAVVLVAGFAALLLWLVAPSSLVDDVTLGRAWLPVAGGNQLLCPLAIVVWVVLALLLWSQRRRIVVVAAAADAPGAVLVAVVLGTIVLAFSTADPSKQVVASSWPVLLAVGAGAAVVLLLRQRRVAHPLMPPGTLRSMAARSAIVVNFLLGVALIAVLVDVPFLARATKYPDSQLGAALELLRFLVALPIGALLGGRLTDRMPARLVAAGGSALAAVTLGVMATWSVTGLDHWTADVTLVASGFGFGLAIAPVNAVLLEATDHAVHGLASALLVVARTVGMLVGLSVLTGLGLHAFDQRIAKLPPVSSLCPKNPASCPAYDNGLVDALLAQLHTIFLGAAISALVAAAVAVVALRLLRPAELPDGDAEHDQAEAGDDPGLQTDRHVPPAPRHPRIESGADHRR